MINHVECENFEPLSCGGPGDNGLTELKQWVRDWAPYGICPEELDDRGLTPRIVGDLARRGLLGMGVPGQLGGLDLNIFDIQEVLRSLAATDLSVAIFVLDSVLAASTTKSYQNESRRDEVLAGIAGGTMMTALGITETAAGSNPRAMRSRAVPDGHGGWTLHGDKRWTGNASWAQVLHLFVQLEGPDGSDAGLTGFAVQYNSPGLEIEPEAPTLGLKAFPKNTVRMEGVTVTPDDLIGAPGLGMETAARTFHLIRILLGGMTVGTMKRCLQLMHRFASRRQVSTGTLADNPVSRSVMAEVAARIACVEALSDAVAHSWDAGETAPDEVYMAVKNVGAESLGYVTDRAIQMLGARGYDENNGLARFYRDARPFRIFEGPTETLDMQIGATVVEHPEAMANYLTNSLNDSNLAKQLVDDAQAITQRCREHGPFSGPDARYQAYAKVGSLASLTLQLAAVRRHTAPGAAQAAAWAEQELSESRNRALRHASNAAALPATCELAEMVEQWDEELPEVLPHLKRSPRLVDPLLAPQMRKPDFVSVIDEIFAHAERSPDRTALEQGPEQLSYTEMARQIQFVAGQLLDAGVRQGDRVAGCLSRSVEAIVAMLAVYRVGGVWVPIDSSYPQDRRNFIFDDASVKVVLTDSTVDSYGSDRVTLNVLDVLGKMNGQPCQSGDDRIVRLAPTDLAYIIYTSGSTGNPKGVMIEQKALSHFVHAAQDIYQITGDDHVLQFASLSFDTSIEEIFPCLAAGGTLVLRTDAMLGTASHFLQAIGDAGITLLDLPTAYWHGMVQDMVGSGAAFPDCLRMVIIGGERCLPERWAMWNAAAGTGPAPILMNTYGPTEATVVATAANLTACTASEFKHVEPPIGKPLPGVVQHILNEQLQPVSDGETGELCLGGNGLARGYLNQPEQTAERFVTLSGGERVYRTGDLVCEAADRQLVFKGRIDNQVKVSGYRIELGEVERALVALDAVSKAAVLTERDSHDDLVMVAHVETPESDVAVIRGGLGEVLPKFMVPSRFVLSNELPVTAGDKVDRNALRAGSSTAKPTNSGPRSAPAPQTQDAGRSLARSNTERLSAEHGSLAEQLLEPWREILGEDAGPDDNYLNAGGNSLLAVHLAIRIRDISGVEVSVADIFQQGTLTNIISECLADAAVTQSEPLRKVDRTGDVPLSYGQYQLWYLHQLAPSQPVYNEPCVLFVPGQVDVDAMQSAFCALIDRHEILRTGFSTKLGEPSQQISDSAQFELAIHSADDWDTAQPIAEDFIRRPFHLDRPPLLRAMLIRTGEATARLVLGIHHIVVDGVSFYGVLLPELQALYEAFAMGGDAVDADLAPVDWHFADYAAWQVEQATSDEDLAWWETQLTGAEELDLPTDFPRPANPKSTGQGVLIQFGSDLTNRMQTLSREQGVTPFGLLTTSLSILLQRYTAQEDVLLGTVINRNQNAAFSNTIGYFDNTLLLRNQIRGDLAFTDQLGRVQNNLIECFARADVPFSRVIEAVRPNRAGGSSQLLRVMLVMEPPAEDIPGRWPHSRSDLSSGCTKFDIMLEIEEHADGLRGRVEFSDELFESATMERFVSHLLALVDSACRTPDALVRDLDLIQERELRLVTREWATAPAQFDDVPHVVSFFETTATRMPDAVAAQVDDETMTYAELSLRSNQLAHHLRSEGVNPGDRVGIFVNRGFDLVTGILGILKAGASYVPLDAAYPADRRAMMLEDSQVATVVTHTSLDCEHSRRVLIDVLDLDALPCTPLDHTPALSDLCYVIYTSGSTGRPKGVAMPHRALVNLIQWQLGESVANEHTTTLQYSPISFDVSFQELFSTWASGGTLLLVSEVERRDPHMLAEVLVQRNVERVFMPVVALGQVADAVLHGATLPASLREVIVAGEQLLINQPMRELFRKLPDASLHNHYGPSETHVVTALPLTGDPLAWPTRPTIGKPIANAEMYILDEQMRPVPIGIQGEVYIGGVALADGYLGRDELTERRFIPDTLSPGKRLYKTGDRGRWLADGTIEFLGRSDNQVKLRGYRIELGEIESALTEHPAVREATADVIKAEGKQDLVAWVVAPDLDDSSALLNDLTVRLPDYMVPRCIMLLDEMPLTPSGKVARRLLPQPTVDDISIDGTREARDEIELRMTRIWSNILEQDHIGVGDDFFDLGGHSLLAVGLMAAIDQEFGVDLPLGELMSCPTVESLSNHVRESRQNSRTWSPIVPVQDRGWEKPIFCAPGSGGNVLYFSSLGRAFGPQRPLYGLQPRGLDGVLEPVGDFSALAREQLVEIKRIQRHGPYLLAGHSIGCCVGLEIARQLEEGGDEVGLFIAMDLPAPIGGETPWKQWDDARWVHSVSCVIEQGAGVSLGVDLAALTAMSADERRRALREAMETHGMLPDGSAQSQVDGIVQTMKWTDLCYADYQPPRLNAPILVVRASDPFLLDGGFDPRYFDDTTETWGWEQLADQVNSVRVPGDHLSMLNATNAGILAAAIESALQQVAGANVKPESWLQIDAAHIESSSLIHVKKMEWWFRALDLDASGAIDAEDFYLFRRRLRDVCGRDLSDPRLQQLLGLQQLWWDKVVEDADMVSDGSISEPEWHAWGEAAVSSIRRNADGAGAQLVEEWATILFELMDENGDQIVCETEYRTFMKAFSTSGADIDLAWSHFDSNRSGRVTRSQFLERLRDFWMTDDPTAAATFFFPPTSPIPAEDTATALAAATPQDDVDRTPRQESTPISR